MIVETLDNFQMLYYLDEYMVGHNGFIAGGCFKNIFNKEKIKDLDIFFNNKEEFEQAVIYYSDTKKNEYSLIYQNGNVIIYKNKSSNIRIELNRHSFGKPEAVLSFFDFTITKFALYRHKENDIVTYKVMYHDNYFEHLMLHRLVIDDKLPYPVSTFERMIRYIKYGYYPCKDTKMKLLQEINKLDENDIQISDNLYNGID